MPKMCDPLHSNTSLQRAGVQNLHLHHLSCLVLKPEHSQFCHCWQQVGPAPTQAALQEVYVPHAAVFRVVFEKQCSSDLCDLHLC